MSIEKKGYREGVRRGEAKLKFELYRRSAWQLLNKTSCQSETSSTSQTTVRPTFSPSGTLMSA